MLIPDHKIDEVRERIDLVALVQRHGVTLKKSGRSFKGCCPFHQEKTPSFYVWADTRRFKCFGCAAGGDAISFVQRLLGKTFVDTVRDLAKEAGVDLEAEVDPAMKERAQIKEATDFADAYFKERLWDPIAGRMPREYLTGRGVGEALARSFGLGWAPSGWTELADRLKVAGLLVHGEKAGLVAPRARGDGHYDLFRGRLIIPIRSPEGRTIAFGGRLLEGDDGPKYLNSRESRLYNKSETLYAMDQARDEIRKKKSAVLCEGYFDAIGLHQAGVKNAVALCSTALTPGHMTVLSRLEAKELVLLLDGDDAGRKAVERLAGPILAAGGSAKVASLPQGEDPDTYAQKHGAEAVLQLVHQAVPLTQHLFATVLPDGREASFEAKMGALDRLKPITTLLPVGLMRSAFFASLASYTGLPAQELEAALRGKASPLRPAPKPGQGEPVPAWRAKSEAPPEPYEALFAACLLKDRKLISLDEHRVADELKHSELRSMVAGLASGQSPEDVMYDASPATKKGLETATGQLNPDTLEPSFKKVCTTLKVHSINEQLTRISSELARLPSKSELSDDAKELLAEQRQLMTLRRELTGR